VGDGAPIAAARFVTPDGGAGALATGRAGAASPRLEAARRGRPSAGEADKN